jgi:hypothetical protein
MLCDKSHTEPVISTLGLRMSEPNAPPYKEFVDCDVSENLFNIYATTELEKPD